MGKKKSKKKLRKILAKIKKLIRQNKEAQDNLIKTIPPKYWNKQQ